ncbi:MAG TPA: lytic transglycosylase domain-containing protein [Vicinamibacterales bacterium]|nr:lytic transglycosylase domain-containing protein [Vicinamibacterales bacterium]
MTRALTVTLCLLPFVFASEARADIVVFTNGRTMSVKSARIVDGTATLRLRQGGEVTFPSSIVARVDPDEVPYPEDEVPEVPGVPQVPGEPSPSDAMLASRPFADLIATLADAHQVDVRLVHAVVEQESNYQARARSRKGAQGLMQLMPATARQYGVRNSYDPKANLDAGIRHLKDLLSRLELPTALAAYNAGEGTIKRYGGLPPYPETQYYVRSILRRVGYTSSN